MDYVSKYLYKLSNFSEIINISLSYLYCNNIINSITIEEKVSSE
jgi:CO dehydrogenase/acetyl-CoA synthase epsilon subunit